MWLLSNLFISTTTSARRRYTHPCFTKYFSFLIILWVYMIKFSEHLVFVSSIRHEERNANTGLTDDDKGRKLDLLPFLRLYYLFVLCFSELKFSFFEQPVSLKFKVLTKNTEEL